MSSVPTQVLNNTNKVIKNTWLDLENTVWKKADGQTENVRNDIFEAVDPHIGKTPLHLSTKCTNHLTTVILLTCGADVEAR